MSFRFNNGAGLYPAPRSGSPLISSRMKSLIFGNSLSGSGPERLPEMAQSNDESHTGFRGEGSPSSSPRMAASSAAQGILRHASSDITMDIYTHAQDEAKRKALERYESRLVQ